MTQLRLPFTSLTIATVFIAMLTFAATTASAGISAPAVKLEALPYGLTEPTWIGSAPNDNAIYVAERRGVIKRISQGRQRVWLDLQHITYDAQGEQGLFAVAFSPLYRDGGRIWVYLVRSNDYAQVIEYTVKNNAVVMGSGRVTIGVPLGPPSAGNHNGGQIHVRPGMQLYVSVGDGGGSGDPSNNGQRTSTRMGKILRVVPRISGGYAVPTNNPWYNNSGYLKDIFHIGLRNPWRFSFDRSTGAMWIGDVGQSNVEEINKVAVGTAGGRNFGWRRFEGNTVYSSSTPLKSGTTHHTPFATYTHANGCSITGGYVYRGSQIPSMAGLYVYADWCGTNLRFVSSPGVSTNTIVTREVGVTGITSFGETNSGELLAVSGTTGRAYRIAAN